MCALVFAVLLNFKHIFIYLAPPYVVYLFRVYCFNALGRLLHVDYFVQASQAPRAGHFQPYRLVQLGALVSVVCTASFLPFLLGGGFAQIRQILLRLFPFQRGLNHAYWAGNVWALYSALDRILVKCTSRFLQ